jgi:enoyl-CoA hydratase/3-hydroxyacyl-CoA dehydrogenase
MKVEDIKRVAVLGGGTMGHGIAQIMATEGLEVTIRDIEQRFLDKALEQIGWSLGKLVEKDRISETKKTETLDRITTTLDLEEAVREADFVVEAVPENIELKREIFEKVDAATSDDAILASNTSTLPITEIAKAVDDPSRVVGMHFFNPPQLMPLVEVIRGEHTTDDVVETTVALAKKAGKETVVCQKDVPGFIVNRILGPLLNEAAWILERDEASREEIDSASKYRLGLPMGLLELADYTGIDVINSISNFFQSQELVDSLPSVWSEYVEKGWLGRKSGRGFYKYKVEKRWERPKIPTDAGKDIDLARLIAPGVNAAAFLVREEVATVEDVDKSVKLGLGFPRGILQMADEFGLDRILTVLRDIHAKYDDEMYSPDPLLERYVEEGRTGKEAGEGFYDYHIEEKKFENIQVRIEKDDKIGWLILNRPHRLNTLNKETIDEMSRALTELREDPDVRVLVIQGEGDRAFSAGADISSFIGVTPVTGAGLARMGQRVFTQIEEFPKPVIAAIDGFALGGGSEMSLACDFRIASERSQIGQPEVNLGLIPGWGGTQRLPRLIGLAKAKELIMLGDRISAEEARDLGLVNKVVPTERFQDEVRDFALRLAAGPPVALRLAKTCMNKGTQAAIEVGLDLEAESFAAIFSTEDVMEGVEAFFAKRKPEFKGE